MHEVHCLTAAVSFAASPNRGGPSGHRPRTSHCASHTVATRTETPADLRRMIPLSVELK